jgi:hypothetical protein
MLEADTKVVWSAMDFVLPNIVYPDELKDLVGRELQRSEGLAAFVDNIKKAISDEADSTRKTDWRIFLNEYRRMVSRKS